jgi:hypothetical protein
MEYLWIFYMFFSFNLKHQDDDPTWHVSHGLKPWAKPNSKPSHSPPNLLVILHHSSHRGISWGIMAIYPIISNIYIYRYISNFMDHGLNCPLSSPPASAPDKSARSYKSLLDSSIVHGSIVFNPHGCWYQRFEDPTGIHRNTPLRIL